jgi:hypothetical protein
MKIDFKNAGGRNIDQIIYESISDMDIHYYRIFGLKLYATCSSEGLKRDYAQKIADYIYSLSSDEFTVHHIEYQKPKIFDGKLHSYWSNEVKESNKK